MSSAGSDKTSPKMISRGRVGGDPASVRQVSSLTLGPVGEAIPGECCRVGRRILESQAIHWSRGLSGL